MNDESILWEGVPIENLSREKLLEAMKTLMHVQKYAADDLSRRIQLRQRLDRMG